MIYRYKYLGEHPCLTSPDAVATEWEPGDTKDVDYVIIHPSFHLVAAPAAAPDDAPKKGKRDLADGEA